MEMPDRGHSNRSPNTDVDNIAAEEKADATVRVPAGFGFA